jgi:hypothetical protein
MSTPGLFSLSRKEGWNQYVNTPPRQRPEMLTRAQLNALGEDAREDYNDRRHDWHANFGIIQTPQLASLHDELAQIVASNRQDGDRIRSAAVIDALPAWARPPSPTSTAAPTTVSSAAALERSRPRATSVSRSSGSG